MENDSIDLGKESVSQLKHRLEKLLFQELSGASKSNILKPESKVVDLFDRIQEKAKQGDSLAEKILEGIMSSPIDDISTEIELSVESKTSDTRNEEDMQELEKAIQMVSNARELLYKILDRKLGEHSIYYYHKKKGIGFRVLNDFEQNRDKLHISTLINNLRKMI
jgi:hypothetical protein